MSNAITVERVRKLAEGYLERLGLAPYELRIEVLHGPDGADEGLEDRVAYIAVQDGYSVADLTVRADLIKVRELPEIIAHEMAHAATWRLARALEAATAKKMHPTITAMDEELANRIGRALVVRRRRKA